MPVTEEQIPIPRNEESKTVKLVERVEDWLPGAGVRGREKWGGAVQQVHSVNSTR